MEVFRTARLTVRQLLPEDLDPMFDMQGNPKVMNLIPAPAQDLETCRGQLANVIDKYNQPENDFWVWAAVLQETQEFIGTVAIVPHSFGPMEIGYRLRERFWRQGFGKELAEGLIKHAFTSMQLEEVLADASVQNPGSVRILDQLMDFVTERQNEDDGGTDRHYRLDRSSWLRRQ